jgi:prophage antirepressor-like protein
MQGSDLQVFQFDPQAPLRAGLTTDGIPYVIAADVCAVAGHTNVSQALSRIDADDKGLISVDTLGGKQNLTYVTEPGFYVLALTFRLRKNHPNYERLKRFRKWVTSEVLPTIRKTGTYSVAPPAEPTGLALEIRNAKQLVAILERQAAQEQRYTEQEVKLVAIEARTETKLAAIEAKADAALAGAGNDTGFLSLMGFCKLHKIRLSAADMKWHGGRLSAECKANGIAFRKAFHEVYSHVNVYPVEVLGQWAVRNQFISRETYAMILLARCRSLDVRFSIESGRLLFDAPKGALDDWLRAELTPYKAELIAAIRRTATDPGHPGPQHGPLDARRNHEQH